MTDNEIIKALECCYTTNNADCRRCAYRGDYCLNLLLEDALALLKLSRPCKVGDEVWAIRSYKNTKYPVKGKVSEMYYIDESMRLCIVVKGITRGAWGEKVFPSFEEAESYLSRELSKGERA